VSLCVCVPQTCWGLPVSSQTAVVLLRSPPLTPTATSRWVWVCGCVCVCVRASPPFTLQGGCSSWGVYGVAHSLHVEVSLSKALNPQLLPGRFTAAHRSSITKDGSNTEKIFPTGINKVYIIIINTLPLSYLNWLKSWSLLHNMSFSWRFYPFIHRRHRFREQFRVTCLAQGHIDDRDWTSNPLIERRTCYPLTHSQPPISP